MAIKQLTLDLTGKKGLSPKFFGDINRDVSTPNLRYNAEEGQMVDGYFNPFVREGYLSPTNYSWKVITAGGNSATYGEVPRAFYDDLLVSAKVYAGTNTRLRISSTTGSFGADGFSQLDSDATSVGTVCDLEMYQVNSVRKLMVAATDKVSIYDTSSGTYDTAWSTTTASGAVSPTASNYSRLVRSDNGFMYWFVGNLVYKLDGTAAGGTNGTISLSLTFNTNQYLYDGVSARGKLFIAINPDASTDIRNNLVFDAKAPKECGIYVWDRSSAVTALSDFYPLQGVHQIRSIYVAPNNDIRVIAVGTDRQTIMFNFTGTEFEKIHELPLSSYPNQPKAVGNGNNKTYWLGADGIFYCNYFDFDNKKDYIVKLLNCNDVATSIAGSAKTVSRAGAILVGGRYDTGTATTGYRVDYESVLISFRDNSSNDRVIRYLPNISGHSFDSVTPIAAQGNVYTGVRFLPTLSTLKHLNIYCVPVAGTNTDSIATVKVYANQSTTAFKTETITKAKANRGYISIELNKKYVNSLQVEIEWNTSQTLGTNDFCPSVAILDYEPTSQTIAR